MIGAALRQFFVKSALQPGRIVIAVSGGADSTALLVAAHEERLDLVAAHVNHHLRGSDSDGDEAFVRELCARHGIELHVMDGTVDPARVRERGVEAAAREVRYLRLAEVRDRAGARYVATAHQQNDQAETVLMRLLSGSGIGGLRGIHPVRDDGFIRPLLDVSRAGIDAFLASRDIVPRFDLSNDDPRFLRNRVRALLRELGGIEALAGVAARAREQWPLLERAIDDAEAAHAIATAEATRFRSWPGELWLRGALLRRHIRRLDPSARNFDAERIAEEVENIRRISVTRMLELAREGDALVLRRRAAAPAVEAFETTLTPDAPARLDALGVTLHVARANEAARPGVSQRIELPRGAEPRFVVRGRRAGDRFQPLGLAAPKKLKDLLIDRKIAAEARDRLPLVLWNGEIVWIPGVEVSERFKVTKPGGGELYELWMEGSGAAEYDRNHSRLQRR